MLVTFLTFAVVFLLVLAFVIFKIMPSGPVKTSTVPGLDSSDEKLGNILDISAAGSFNAFLMNLHEKFGPIASFWYGKQFCVSLANEKLFKEVQHLFDRPALLFDFLSPVVTKLSIQFANGADGRERHKLYSEAFAHGTCVNLLPSFNKICKELGTNWSTLPLEEHIPLHEYMMALAIRLITSTQFGTHFKKDKSTLEFHHHYDKLMVNLEAMFAGEFDKSDKERFSVFQKSLQEFTDTVKKMVNDHKESRESGDYEKAPFLDALLDHAGHNESEVLADAITFVVGGFHTTGNLLTWMFYYMILYPEIQEKVADEIQRELQGGELTNEIIEKLKYTKQVLEETLRCSITATFGARVNEKEDMKIGGHLVEAGTPIVLSLGASLRDSKHYDNPDEVDPENFSTENVKRRPNHAFSPFGIGSRKCPGYKFAYFEVYAAVAALIPKFKFIPAFESRDEFEVPISYGFVTKPESEIWIKILKRES